MSRAIILAGSPAARYTTGAVMYFAQGIPQGLLSIAIPAWLASQGVGASEIGSYLAVVVLPWAFKLVSGPFMDRYEFLPMGRRRPWVLGAQLGLTLSLLALMLIDNPAEQIGLLMLVGVLINTFAATQDVAVDGMSIDLTPTREQGRLNAFMSFGKAIGWSATSAVSGLMLVTVGLKATAVVASIVAGVILLAFIFVVEREGERSLPWTKGEAASTHKPGNSFKDVFRGINQVLWLRASLVVMVIMFFDGLIVGYGQALMPIAAVQLFGYTTPQWSQLVAIMGLTGAVLSLVFGPLIDRFGSKRMMLLTVSLVAVHAFMIAQTQHLWQDSTYVRVMLSAWILMLPIVMVCVIALAMAVCSQAVSATQFAIYMSVSNFGYSAGSKIYGMFAEGSNFAESYMVLGAFVITLIAVLLFYRDKAKPGGRSDGGRPRTHTVAIAGGESGHFWSGAMRCPKCRADMEQIVHDGTEIDRCVYCKGIWFDAGEIESLKSKEAAKALDTGSATEGKYQNKVDDYPCPRCNGEMQKIVDEQQRHIWYETCAECEGSFFDAGEFKDLAELTVADFFKRLSITDRK